MNTKKRIVRIVSILFVMVCFSMISFAQKPAASNVIGGKVQPFSGFKNTDIGAATKPGKATINKEGLKIVASGADIWGTHDGFHFSYKMLKGDFDMRVQVLSLSATNLYTKAGIMARTNISDSCQHVLFQIFPNNSSRNKNNGGCEFQYRTVSGGEMKAIYPDPKVKGNACEVAFPKTWIRLKRKGDVFESYFSNDNQNWKLYSTFSLKIPNELMVGLAVTAHDSNAYTTAQFGPVRLIK